MNRFEKALDRIKMNVIPQDNWSEEDYEHFKTVNEALKIAAEKTKKDNDIDPRVAFICDRKAECRKSLYCGKECKHTFDLRHAERFEIVGEDRYIEKE